VEGGLATAQSMRCSARRWIRKGEGYLGGEERKGGKYRLYISDTMSISASACAIFCSDEICGRPPMPKKDMLCVVC
jgi:hypothetical protein